MKRKKIIQKILIITAWFLMISGITTLLIAANSKQKEHVCREVSISIRGTGENLYIQKEDIKKQIERTANGSLLQRPVMSIDLAKLERALKNNPWIFNAQLYFNSKDELNIYIKEREPIARIFTMDGSSFYMDSSGQRMPLLEQISARVPVVTGFVNSKKLNAKDSILLNEVKQVAGFIHTNEFWNAQVGEINITDDQKFELIPVIGDHIIKVGNSDHLDEKLNRLFVFYKQIMSKAGFNKYAALDIQFDGQVVAVKKGTTSTIDSTQLKKNIDELMIKASLPNADEGVTTIKNSAVNNKKDTTINQMNPDPSASTGITHESEPENQSNSAKTNYQSKPKEEPNVKSKEELRKPKAVMKKVNH